MNDGVQSPEQAARSLRVVRLVSFVASALLAVLVLIGIAMLRYAPTWPEPEAPRVAIVNEIAREAPRDQPQTLPRSPRRLAEPEEAPAPTAPAQPAAPSEPVVITDPVWLQRPRNPERFYPREAFMRGVAGEVMLDCEVDTEGRLICVVVSETPDGRGFGEAALRIAGAHTMRPATQNGAPVRGRYRMVVPFSPGE